MGSLDFDRDDTVKKTSRTVTVQKNREVRSDFPGFRMAGKDYWMIILPQVSHSTSVPFLILVSVAEGSEVLQPEHWP